VGSDSFTFKVNDGTVDSSTATVAITVTPVNDAPVAGNLSVTMPEDTVTNLVLVGSDSESAVTFAILNGPAHGGLSGLDTNTGAITYAPTNNYQGPDSFTFAVSDGSLLATGTVSITVTPVNDVPVTENDAYVISEDATLAVGAAGVMQNDRDVDGDTLRAIVASNPTNGTLILNTNGAFTYRPDTNFFGQDRFTYTANDSQTNSRVTLVTINVTPVNDAPSFVKGPNQLVNQNASAQTIPNWATSITAGPANESYQIVNFAANNDNTVLFSVQPAIGANGTLTYTPAPDAYGVATVTVALKDNGGTADGGKDTSPSQVFYITVNAPPVVNIVTPTNNSAFIVGQSITIMADAFDLDGVVTNVGFFVGTNKLAETADAPYSADWTNATVGTYQLRARATDNLGLSAWSGDVNITVLPVPPLTVDGPIRLNYQTGFFEQTARIHNPTPFNLDAVGVLVYNLPAGWRVQNATFVTNGVPGVQYSQPLPAGADADITIKYYLFNNAQTNVTPTLVAFGMTTINPVGIVGTPVNIRRGTYLSDGTFLINFNTTANVIYYVQYSEDLIVWKTSPQSITGTGNFVQWLDYGPPATDSLPKVRSARFYRVVRVP